MTVYDKLAGNRVREMRMDAGWTASEFAGVFGIPQSALYAIENGSRAMSAFDITLICRAIGCTPNDIFAEAVIASGAP